MGGCRLHGVMWLAWAAVVAGCGGSDAPAADPTPSAVLVAAFGDDFFDAAARGRWFADGAGDALVLPGLVDADRYRFLHVAEVRRLSADSRAGAVAFAVDGWPLALAVELRRGADGWRIAGLEPPAVQRALVALLGPDGLPRAPTARPWRGGLAGRDAVGRPTAQVLVLATAERVTVDGRTVVEAGDAATYPVAPAVGAALRAALDARARLAREAHATSRPQAALALPASAPAAWLPQLAAAAREAGAEELFLVVRGPDGEPAALALARRTAAPSPAARARAVHVREAARAVDLRLGDAARRAPLRAGRVDPGAIAEALRALSADDAPIDGAVITPAPGADHRRTVALLDACRAAQPALALLVEAP